MREELEGERLGNASGCASLDIRGKLRGIVLYFVYEQVIHVLLYFISLISLFLASLRQVAIGAGVEIEGME